MMLGGKDHCPEPGGPGGARPLAGIERGGREDGGILGAVAPLAIGERVDAEVEEESQLVPLPGELSRRGNRPRGPRTHQGSEWCATECQRAGSSAEKSASGKRCGGCGDGMGIRRQTTSLAAVGGRGAVGPASE